MANIKKKKERERERVLKIERGSTRSQSVENSVLKEGINLA